MEGIIHFGPDNFVYSDTDSLFLINVDKKLVDDYCGEGLGAWEIEKFWKNGRFIRPKNYVIRDEKKKILKKGTAGFRKDSYDHDHLIDKDKIFVKDAIKKSVRADGGLVIRTFDKIIDLNNDIVKKKAKYKKDELQRLKEVYDAYEELVRANKKNKKL